MTLLERIQAILPGYDLEEIRKANDRDVQFLLNDALRAAAIMHLREGMGTVAQGFRDAYEATLDPDNANALSLNDYLIKQGTAQVWAKEPEIAALAELLGINVYMTVYSGETKQTTAQWVGEKQGDVTLRIHNDNRQHYEYRGVYSDDNTVQQAEGKITIGNGDCAYNAFAFAIRDFIKLELAHQADCADNRADLSSSSPAAYDLTSSAAEPAASLFADEDDVFADVEDALPRSRSTGDLPSANALQSHGLFASGTSYAPEKRYSAEKEAAILASQKEIEKLFQKPDVMEVEDDAAPALSVARDSAEQAAIDAQIASDYQYALQLAEEEMQRRPSRA